ncbi:hypothetical protein KIW84_UN0761 [Lathyrus oleraceus]|nr:hypothetical protein KIW84_UN0761 [Pisum sativum]
MRGCRFHVLYATSLAVCMYSLISWRRVINGCYLVDPASSHMLVSRLSHACALPVALMIHDTRRIARPLCWRRIIQISALSTFDGRIVPTMVVTGDGELGSIPEGSLKTATTSRKQQARKLTQSNTGSSDNNNTTGLIESVKKLVVGPWVGLIGPPLVCTGWLVPSAGDALLALIGRGQSVAFVFHSQVKFWIYERRTTAKHLPRMFSLIKNQSLGARRRSDTVLVSTINDADQGSADGAFRLRWHLMRNQSLWFRGEIPSKRESSARVDYVPALCKHRPSLLPIEWSGEVFGLRRRGAVRCPRRCEKSTEPYQFRGRRSRNKVSVGEPAK